MINHTVKMQRDSERGIASVMTVIVMLITAFLVVSYLNVSMKELNVTERLVPNDLPTYKVEAKSENNDHALRPLLGAGLVAKAKG